MKFAKILGTILLAAVSYVIGLVLMGMAAAWLHLSMTRELPNFDPQHAFLITVLFSPLLAVGLLPLAAGLGGPWFRRCAAVAVLLYVTLGLNTLLELKIFSTLVQGSAWLVSLPWLLPSLLVAAALTYRVRQNQSADRILGNFTGSGWAWRLAVAWLAFPIIYFLFGMFVAPIVVPYYNSTNSLGLHIPGMDVIGRTVLVRSATFLLASLPAIALWTKSRGQLIFALGFAHAITVGIFQLAQATFLPVVIRIAHALEISCDSFAYAAVLTLLFTQLRKAALPGRAGEVALA